ncbi:MAG: hypothetical protein EXR71_11005 [Myxococcales bacterium]|nr:hypothetical protein [Myxococcales bacterium]
MVPSLAAAYAVDGRWRSPDVAAAGGLALVPPRRFDTPGVGEPVTVCFAGDSTSATLDLPASSSWWYRVAVGVAGGRPLTTVNVASPGADAEDLADALGAIDGGCDLALLGLFADDLQDYESYSVDQRWVLLPEAAPRWLEPLVTRSYSANLAWFAAEKTRDAQRGRRIDEAGLTRLDGALRAGVRQAGALGARHAFVLFPAPNLGDCPAAVEPDHPCRTYPDDLDAMASRLGSAAEAYVDLRDLFASTRFTLSTEDQEQVAVGRLRWGVHVGLAGQATIGDEVLRQLDAIGLAEGGLSPDALPTLLPPPVADPATVASTRERPPVAAGAPALRVAGPDALFQLVLALQADASASRSLSLSHLGASGAAALTGLVEGRADVALLGRALRPAESGFTAVSFGHSVAAVLVAAENPVVSLTRTQLHDLFVGDVTTWRAVGGNAVPVAVVDRGEGAPMKLLSDTLRLQGRLRAALVAVELSPCEAGVLAPATLAELARLPTGCRALAVDGVVPAASEVRAGRYPLSGPLVVATLGSPIPEAQLLIDQLLSDAGQARVADGYVGVR